MTLQKALKEAQRRWGKKAAVKSTPRGARIGAHGEYLPTHLVTRSKPGTPTLRDDRYRCQQCSTAIIDDAGELIERTVWHRAGGWQSSYTVGRIALGMFFEVEAEGESFEAAFARVDAKKGAA